MYPGREINLLLLVRLESGVLGSQCSISTTGSQTRPHSIPVLVLCVTYLVISDMMGYALLPTVVVSFERAVYSVNEGDGTTDVCVILTGGPQMENISVRVETTPIPCVNSGRSALITFDQ